VENETTNQEIPRKGNAAISKYSITPKCTSKRVRQRVQRRKEVKREAATGNNILRTQGKWKRVG
jgi:hypothetical protein